ncbi:DDB1- and CUL4-associated factor 8 isoform X3 [Plutella xylostella]|uniref:DDB1- and CUL4-associated factor 8 isoform X3 n=1 Tax=Plutella xylostella TaxID=51655 RepID=UPI002032310F|nr:DDB1- and CUL4-associated factor 8 isoform X3 [Plutella xylostella]
MEDNSSDDDIRENNVSPRMGGKKQKLNDGSSQESIKEPASSSKGEKEENVDSGVSADKSESTSSEDRAAGSSGAPSNEVVSVAPSSSNMRAILLNIRRPKRNYRKRRTPDRESSSDSSRDSDDLSGEEAASGSRQTENSDDDESIHEDILGHRLIGDLTSESSDSEVYLRDSSDDTNSYESDELVASSGRPEDGDSDDEGLWPRGDDEEETSDASKGNTPSVLKKTRPKHNYLLLREIINREMGLTFPCGKVAKENVMFEQKFYGSLHVVQRLKKLHHLNKHKGCVNSVNFHPEGNLLASGSDDMNVIVWDWARNLRIQTIKTGHKSNVFQSKFLHLNARSQLNIVTCARDGQVRLLQCPPSGGAAARRRLASHAGAAHKLHVSAAQPHCVLSAGEDGRVLHCDVRAPAADKLVQVKDRSRTIQLYSIHGHPLDPSQFAVAGRDRFVRVFDRRSCAKPTALYCPHALRDHGTGSRAALQASAMHLTCAVYSHDGREILGSYNDEDVYLFDAQADVYDKDNPKEGYTHRYSGHRNSATVKGVSFFGPNSEYIVSGSDCSFIYIWEKKSEAIVQWMQGDSGGVVNCIETHPRAPVLATSGLDKDVKIWIPMSGEDPDYSGLEAVVRENSVSILRSPLFNDFLPSLYTAWRGDDRGDELPRYVAQEFHQNVCTAF